MINFYCCGHAGIDYLSVAAYDDLIPSHLVFLEGRVRHFHSIVPISLTLLASKKKAFLIFFVILVTNQLSPDICV